MEKLSIVNFLSISKVDIELKKINIFIGPQAQGKSIIAKLINFFKDIPMTLSDLISKDMSMPEFKRKQLEKFKKMFPEMYWEDNEFEIKYVNKYFSVKIINEGNETKKSLKIIFSSEINKVVSNARIFIRKFREIHSSEIGEWMYKMRLDEEVSNFIRGMLFKNCKFPTIDRVFYIPAGRSFFANLQKNIFSFLSSNIKIDYFLTEFGSIYESTKEMSKHIRSGIPNSVNKHLELLIKGKFLVENGEDWIVDKNKKINVVNSSSGQQEALPMALILSIWPYIGGSDVSRSFIIEEPEAHLFPSAQGVMVSLIATAYNSDNSNITITTHSPYILSALNILIQAGNTLSERPEAEKEIYKIVPKDEIINCADVSAYFISGGIAKSIFDYELNIIDANKIDEISNVFSEKFDSILDIQYRG